MNVEERSFQIVGAPFELGSRTSGPALAPEALRTSGLTSLIDSLTRRGVTASDLGDVAAPSRGESDSNPRNLDELVAYSHDLMPRLARVYSAGACPIVIGGAPELVGLGGFSPKVRPENVAFIGLRDVLRCERDLIESHGMPAYTATGIDRLGIATICDRVFGHMSTAVSAFVLSFDVDACDPLEAPGVEYPERGGLTFREARLIAEYAADAAGLLCVEVLEIIPELDRDARSSKLAVSFLRSVTMGKPVYRSGQPG